MYPMMLLGINVVWGILLHQFDSTPIFWTMGPYAAATSLVLLSVRGDALRRALRPTPRSAAVGIGTGLVMTAAT